MHNKFYYVGDDKKMEEVEKASNKRVLETSKVLPFLKFYFINNRQKEENSFSSTKLSRYRPTNYSGRQKEKMGQFTIIIFYHPGFTHNSSSYKLLKLFILK